MLSNYLVSITEFERFRGPTIKYSNGGASCPKPGLGILPCNAIPMYRLEKGPQKKVDPTVLVLGTDPAYGGSG